MGTLPSELRRTATFDNGKEFAQHEKLAELLELQVFFAKPYCAWQRGRMKIPTDCSGSSFPKALTSRGSAIARWPARRNYLTNVPAGARLSNTR